MKDERKTKKQLIAELMELRQQLSETSRKVAAVDASTAEQIHIEAEAHARAEARSRAEERNHALYEFSPDGIVTMDLDGHIIECNRAYAEMLGYRREELEGFPFHDTISRRRHDFCDKIHQEVMERGYSYEFEKECIRKDGAIFPASMRSWRIDDESGKPIGIWSLVRDVTERKHKEEELRRYSERLEELVEDKTRTLRESGESFRSLAENANDGILITVMDEGLHVYANKRAAEITGYSVDELLKTSIKDLTHPDEFKKVMRRHRKRLAGEDVPEQYETTFTRKDGRDVPIELTAARTTWHGQPAVIAIIRDITERKLAEKALRESEQEKAAILGSMRELVVYQDLDLQMLWANRAAGESVGLSSEQLVGKHCYEIWHQQSKPCAGCPVIQARESGQPQEAEVTTPDGRAWFVRGYPIQDADGKTTGVVEVTLDITERKHLEEQMRLQERLAAVGQLAGGIAHDFNNFLTTIMLYAQILLRKTSLPPKLAPVAKTILEESRRAAQLVHRLLDFSHRSLIETRPVDLSPFVEETVDILRRTLPENIQLLVDIGSEEYIVNADPARIQQVVMNLALNSRDAMPDGGKLHIGLSRAEVRAGDEPPVAEMTPGEWVCLTISDTGTGMTEEVQSHLFEPFFTTKGPKGTGLGLAQVYGVVKRHDGHIRVKTQAGQGTTFRVYLTPHRAIELKKSPKATSAPSQGQGETILLVEDEDRLREAGSEILESLGYRVLAAANGQKAMQVYRSAERVDLVLTDLVMPEMGGKKLAQELKKIAPHVKVLAITGYTVAEDVEELKQAGILDVVHKPFEVKTLAEVVRQTLDGG